MSARYREHSATRGDPWRPPALEVFPAVAAFSHFWCTVRTQPAVGSETDDTGPAVVGQVTMAGGGIAVVDSDFVQITFPSAITKTWLNPEYFYDVQARLVADGEPYTLARGRLIMGWAATQTP